MTIKLGDNDFNCFALDEDTAVIKIQNKNFVFDYSLLMDFLTQVATVAAHVEDSIEKTAKKETNHELH